MKARVLFLSTTIALTSGCFWDSDNSGNDSGIVVPPTPPIATPPPPPGSQVIGAAGGIVSLTDVAQVQFPPGSLSANTRVTIRSVDTQSLRDSLQTDEELFSIRARMPTAVEVQIDGIQPNANVMVTIPITQAALSGRPANTGVRILAASETGGDFGEIRPYFELIVPEVEQGSNSSQIRFTAQPSHFAQRRSGSHIGVFLITFAPGP